MSERVWSTSTRVVLFAATGKHVGHTGMPLAVPVTELSHRVTGIRVLMIVIIMIITTTHNVQTSRLQVHYAVSNCTIAISSSQTLDSKLGLPILMISYVT